MPDVSVTVVIVSYRCARLTIDALRSIQSERDTHGLQIRAVVVDNASGDFPVLQTAVAANGWQSWVTLLLAPSNGGFAYGNNLGVRRAFEEEGPKPDYIYLMNPDAQVRPAAILTLVRFLAEHPRVGIAGSSFESLDGAEWPIAFRFPTLLSELSQALPVGLVTRLLRRWIVAQHMTPVAQPVDWISGASMMIRPAVFASIGGLDENYFLYFEETDFCYRAKRAGFATWYVPESRVMHIAGQSTNVVDGVGGRTRLPTYWFESRRRYFAVTFGVRHAMLIDLIVLLAYPLGYLKRALLRQRGGVPHFFSDLVRCSVLRRRNRDFPPLKSFQLRA